MNKVAAVGLAVIKLLKTYPALSAALANFGVFAAGYFGLHVTAGQLVGAVGVLDVLFGLIVHANVTPLAKLPPASHAITPEHIVTSSESSSFKQGPFSG